MSWAKTDDNLPDHPKIIELGNDASLVFIYSILYCHRHQTNGFLDHRIANALLKRYCGSVDDVEGLLVRNALWETVENGYQVHDYLKHQESRERIEEVRSFNRKRQHKFRSLNVTRYEKDRNATVTVPDKIRSDQSREEKKDIHPAPSALPLGGVVDVSGNGSGEVAKIARKKFIPPTVDEVRLFCSQKHSGIDPVEFVAYYEARGWHYKGNVPMKNWKAAIATWEMNRHEGGTNA